MLVYISVDNAARWDEVPRPVRRSIPPAAVLEARVVDWADARAVLTAAVRPTEPLRPQRVRNGNVLCWVLRVAYTWT